MYGSKGLINKEPRFLGLLLVRCLLWSVKIFTWHDYIVLSITVSTAEASRPLSIVVLLTTNHLDEDSANCSVNCQIPANQLNRWLDPRHATGILNCPSDVKIVQLTNHAIGKICLETSHSTVDLPLSINARRRIETHDGLTNVVQSPKILPVNDDMRSHSLQPRRHRQKSTISLTSIRLHVCLITALIVHPSHPQARAINYWHDIQL